MVFLCTGLYLFVLVQFVVSDDIQEISQQNTSHATLDHQYSPILHAIIRRPNHTAEESRIHAKVQVVVSNPENKDNVVISPPMSKDEINTIYYSSNVMDYNVDISQYLKKNSDHMNVGSSQTDSPCEYQDCSVKKRHKKERRRRNRERQKLTKEERIKRRKERRKRCQKESTNGKCVKAMLRDEGYTVERRISQLRPPEKYPINRPEIIALSNPKRVYVQVWENDTDDDLNETVGMAQCIRCPSHMVLIASYQQDRVILPVPALSICSRLARLKGRLNMAVTSGPKPGTSLTEGEYPVELLAWKKRFTSSCSYTVSVKVKKCSDLKIPRGVFMDCSKGNIWGSICAFSCIYKHEILIGSSETRCEQEEANDVAWSKLVVPYCREATPNKCKRPPSPKNGVVVCGVNSREVLYEHGSVCQYFCEPGYDMVSYESNGRYPFHCQNGKWSPTVDIACIQNYCVYPKAAAHGTVSCTGYLGGLIKKSKVDRSEVCTYGCKDGYVMPTSQKHLAKTVCKGPEWNSTRVPSCVAAVSKDLQCSNQTFVVEEGERLDFTSLHLPPALSRREKFTCSPFHEDLKLEPGSHLNKCKVIDPETGFSSQCSYYIIVRERKPPVSNECRTRVKYVSSPTDTVVLRSMRFNISAAHQEGWKQVRANCSLAEQALEVGNYTNNCTIIDPIINVTGSCVQSVIVKEMSCPKLKTSPNSRIACKYNNTKITSGPYRPKTECSYKCNRGYFVPKGYLNLTTKLCDVNYRWNNTKLPFCKSMHGLRLINASDCSDKEIYLENGQLWDPLIPTYVSAVDDGEVQVICSLKDPLGAGNYTNICSAKDLESGFERSCTYNVVIQDENKSTEAVNNAISIGGNNSSKKTLAITDKASSTIDNTGDSTFYALIPTQTNDLPSTININSNSFTRDPATTRILTMHNNSTSDILASDNNSTSDNLATDSDITSDNLTTDDNLTFDNLITMINSTDILTTDTISTSDILTTDTISTSDILTTDNISTSDTLTTDTISTSDILTTDVNITADILATDAFSTKDVNSATDILATDANSTTDILAMDASSTKDILATGANSTTDILANYVNLIADILVTDVNSTTDTLETDFNRTTDILATDINSTTNIFATNVNSTTDILSTDVNSTTDILSTDVISTVNIFATDVNSTADILSTDVNSTTDILSTEVNSTTDILSTDVNSTTDILSTDVKSTTDILSTDVISTINIFATDVNSTTDSLITNNWSHVTTVATNPTTTEDNFATNFTTTEDNFATNFTTTEDNFATNFTTTEDNFVTNFTTIEDNFSTNFTTTEDNFATNFTTTEDNFATNFTTTEASSSAMNWTTTKDSSPMASFTTKDSSTMTSIATKDNSTPTLFTTTDSLPAVFINSTTETDAPAYLVQTAT